MGTADDYNVIVAGEAERDTVPTWITAEIHHWGMATGKFENMLTALSTYSVAGLGTKFWGG